MRIGIYARKSIYSDKSDSVNNQIRMCKEYINIRYGKEHSFSEYKDEGFTGANTNRPELKRLLNDIESKAIDLLIIYQLDRLSRSVKDFSDIYAMLDDNGIIFVSVKENVDTDTPIGRAMTMITMVFAQMERETIAERVSDNMQGLARMGLWTGGKPPLGFSIVKTTLDNKNHSMLAIDPLQADYVKRVFTEFTENNYTLSKMVNVYKTRGIKSDRGNFFSTTYLHRLLQRPYYCVADKNSYNYFSELGCNMVDDVSKWDGKHGIMIYGKKHNTGRKLISTSEKEWVVCCGLHEPFIPSEMWLKAQSQLHQHTYFRERKNPPPLLKSILRCSKCGNLMRPEFIQARNYFMYTCSTRRSKGKEYCDMTSIKASSLDDKVLEIFKGIAIDDSVINNYTETSEKNDYTETIKALEKQFTSVQKRIERLTETLADGTNISKYIIKQIETEDNKLNSILTKLNELKSAQDKQTISETDAKNTSEKIKELISDIDNFTESEKNEIAREIISECKWDGNTLFLKL